MKNGKKSTSKSNEVIVREIPLSLIDSSPYQPRQQFSPTALNELSMSITENGLLQPIALRPVANRFQLIAGERRLKASRLAGLEKINSIIVNVDSEQAALLCMVENLQREQLHFFEEAEGYLMLISMHNMTQHELAKKIGKQKKFRVCLDGWRGLDIGCRFPSITRENHNQYLPPWSASKARDIIT